MQLLAPLEWFSNNVWFEVTWYLNDKSKVLNYTLQYSQGKEFHTKQ